MASSCRGRLGGQKSVLGESDMAAVEVGVGSTHTMIAVDGVSPPRRQSYQRNQDRSYGPDAPTTTAPRIMNDEYALVFGILAAVAVCVFIINLLYRQYFCDK